MCIRDRVKPAIAALPAAKQTPVVDQKPLDPDEVIRAAIEADMARNKRQATPVATGTVPQKKPTTGPRPSTPSSLPDQGPRLRASAD